MNTSKTHADDELCNICVKPMGQHHPVTSIQMVCCTPMQDKWFHKNCLKRQAALLKDDFKCPLCADTDTFRLNMLVIGVHIPKSQQIPLYESDSEDEAPVQKKKRIHKVWIHDQTFESRKQAEEFVASENWAYHYKNVSSEGERITYRCGNVKFRGKQWEASVYLLHDSHSTKTQLFRADAHHTHENHPNAIETIPNDIQIVIKQLFDNTVTKPKAVVNNLLNKGIDPPPLPKIKTFLKKLNDERYGEKRINCGQLEKWLADNSTVPENETDPFVAKYEINCEKEEDIQIRFLVTSKLLLQQAIGVKNTHPDATYKLTWQGFPVLVMGFTDLHRSFHPIGIAVCSNEQQKDFEFIFESIVEAIHSLFNETFEPQYLISDAAKAIHNAGKKVFGDNIQIIMCWYHMRKNVSDHVP